MVYARFALLRASLRHKEESLFCGFAARVNSCPDTCMAGGCGVAVKGGYADSGRAHTPILRGREHGLPSAGLGLLLQHFNPL
jgi:hypothetical protein